MPSTAVEPWFASRVQYHCFILFLVPFLFHQTPHQTSSLSSALVRQGRQLRPRDRADGHGWVKEDPDFNAADDSAVSATHTIELKKRPSGIKRYTHGIDGKGAMVMDMNEKARYPGDPLGQAAVAGVKKGYVVKTVNGTDVRNWDFEDIMDLLEDFIPDPDVQSTAAFKGGAQRVRKHQQVTFPVTIEYVEMKPMDKAAASAGPAVPAGAWMPRLSGWSDEDLMKERQRAMAMPEPAQILVASDVDDAFLQRPFLFNGDFVDRGSWSIEVILLIYAMKMKHPNAVFMNRGNHEMLEANMIYGFAGETGSKYDLDLFNLFSESFRNLPLLHLVNNEVLVVHAGIPGPRPRVWLPGQTHDPEDAVPVNARATTLAEIASVDRYTELTPNSYKEAVDSAPRQEQKWETDTRMIIDFLWSDPRGGSGYGPSYRKSRGVFMFGPDVTAQFCRENNVKLLIRSHEVKAEGYLKDHDTLMSVFSAPNYLDTGGNKGAFLQLVAQADDFGDSDFAGYQVRPGVWKLLLVEGMIGLWLEDLQGPGRSITHQVTFLLSRLFAQYTPNAKKADKDVVSRMKQQPFDNWTALGVRLKRRLRLVRLWAREPLRRVARGEAPRVMAFEALEVPQLSEAKRGVIRSYQFRGGSEPAPDEGADGDQTQNADQGLLGGAAEIVPILILGYFGKAYWNMHGMLYPKFPDFDSNHRYLEKFQNRIERGEELTLDIFIKESKSQPTIARDASPDWTVKFPYDEEDFIPSSKSVLVNVSSKMLTKTKNVWLTARLRTLKGDRVAEAHGGMIKYDKMKAQATKYWLASGEVCEDNEERAYGSEVNPLTARGVPKMQVRLVYDRTHYPRPWKNAHYYPPMYVDEFWMTNDQLVKFPPSGEHSFTAEIHFSLMSAARWRFQNIMDQSIKNMATQFAGEDAEEIVQMRDLFANTNSYLLIGTFVVSVLHMIFEYLALKHDVLFWQKTDAETLKRYISLRAILGEIFCNVVLWIYLYDQDTGWLVLILMLGQIAVDCWKLTRVLEVRLQRSGLLMYPTLRSRVPHSSTDDYDKMALQYLSYILVPIVLVYAMYSLKYECHKGIIAYLLHVSASMVYALGFALMTPQLFINYRMKSVAYLPWKRFVYRAINTFIDDLFSFIIKMPTMHRMSCFRDDIVFLIYLYQRHIYPVDKARIFDEDFVDSAEGTAEERLNNNRDRSQ
ncbi:Cleft lip and palate transmembrane protein 1 homolog [Durusdinium trenchii]|uniref:Serine/threonine-protein phosphatase n=1 Tax=Durusdinium trenchii TaxID=1381693 RepID=A0ABP0J2C2_9DINO